MIHHKEPAYVGVLDLVDELADQAVEADEAVRRARLLAVELDRGPVPEAVLRCVPGARGQVAGFLVTDGMLLADTELAGRTATQLLGPGDVIAPPVEPEGALSVRRRLKVERSATLAVLDERLQAVAQRWPVIAARVVAAGARQLERAATQQAISQLSRVEFRLLAQMHHLAGRWGRVTSEGLVVDLDLTHAMLGQLIGARRPTVSLALKWLDDEGLLHRRADGAWQIAPAAADLLADGAQPRLAESFVLAPRSGGPLAQAHDA